MDRAHYIIVRRDLPFGTTLAMVGHAAAESGMRTKTCQSQDTIVILGVANESELNRLAKRLNKLKIKHIVFREPDSPWNGQSMSIGVIPHPKTDTFRKHFKKLALYKEFYVPVNSTRLDVLTSNHTAYIAVR